MNNCKQCNSQIKINPRAYCSRECVIIFYNKSKNNKLYLGINKKGHCKQCGKIINSYVPKFCGHSCRAKFNNLLKKPRSLESRKKTSASMKRAHIDPANKLKWKIKYDSQRKFYTLVCRNCKKKFVHKSRNKIYCSKPCLKKGHSKLRIENPRNNWGKSGKYRGIICQSTYELAFVIWAIDKHKNIVKCKLQIDYEFEGRYRKYNPDFEIDGKIYEIKGWSDERSLHKVATAIQKGIPIILLNKKKMKKYLDYVNTKYNCNIEKDYNKFYD